MGEFDRKDDEGQNLPFRMCVCVCEYEPLSHTLQISKCYRYTIIIV